MSLDSPHTVKSFDQDLAALDRQVSEMGRRVLAQLGAAIGALAALDTDAAEQVIARDPDVDRLEQELYVFTLRLLVRRQPMANDLRVIVAAQKVSGYLERIGDYAKNLAMRTTALTKAPLVSGTTQSIQRMGRQVQEMIEEVLAAFLERDVASALAVRERDRDVDQLYTSLFRELLTYMMEDAHNITPATHLLFVAKNLERVGDHATGIAEQVQFMVEGALPDDLRPKDDVTSSMVLGPEDVGAGDADGR